MTEQAAAKHKKETEATVFELLRERYSPDQWILAPQVPNGTGANPSGATRTRWQSGVLRCSLRTST